MRGCAGKAAAEMFLWGALKPTDIVRAAHALADIAAERRAARAEKQAPPADRPMGSDHVEQGRPTPTESETTALRKTLQNQDLS